MRGFLILGAFFGSGYEKAHGILGSFFRAPHFGILPYCGWEGHIQDVHRILSKRDVKAPADFLVSDPCPFGQD